jgi:hypothetical protein
LVEHELPKRSGEGEPRENHSGSLISSDDAQPPETAQNRRVGQNVWDKTPEWSKVAADAAISAYLRAAADEIAERILN